MKRTITLIPLLMMVVVWVSCEAPNVYEQNALQSKGERFEVKNNMLHFESQYEFNEVVTRLKENGNDLKKLITTKSTADNNFVSLRQHLREQNLRNFTDSELSEVLNESLEYEPEDSIVIDPYMANVLNPDREVRIKDDVWRFVDNGVIVYNLAHHFNPNTALIPDVDSMAHGEKIMITDDNTCFAKFIKIDYGTGGNSHSSIQKGNDDLMLGEGIVVHSENIERTYYEKNGGSGSWIANTVSSFFGLNVSITNYFNRNHRMKLRMYEQDYILYRAVGMTIRMQKRKFGIWWRKKAEEMRYGWTEMVCKYQYKHPVFPATPKKINGLPQPSKYPIAMVKKFPFSDSKVVLFRIPCTNYDVTTGSLNKVIKSGIKAISSMIDRWFKDEQNQGMAGNPRGVFMTLDNDRIILTSFPKGEYVKYDTGRSIVRWDQKMFSGNYSVGFSTTIGGKFRFDNINISVSEKVSIVGGKIYGAVKYDDEWKACVIETR